MTQVKLRNKGNGLTVQCDQALAEVLIARGGWAKARTPKATTTEVEADSTPEVVADAETPSE